jgi:Putative beta-barrel porin-2, OmpL-like. bbp2
MRRFGQNKILSWVVGAGLLFSIAVPSRLFADDDGNKNDPAAPASGKPTKPDAPAPGLTERERMLLDRVEQLEKRVAELEAKGSAVAPPVAPTGPAETNGAAAGTPGTNTAAVSPASPPSTGPVKSAGAIDPGTTLPAAPSNQDQTTSTTAAAVATTGKPANVEPFSDADWTWLNGNPRTKEIFWDSKFFTPEIRVDTNYVADFNHPTDHTIGGSSELFRSYEVQLEQLGVGGDFHYDNVRGRLMTQFGMYSETTPRNDPSPGHGQWDLADAYRYVSEAYGGYHFNVLHGINVDAGIFMSYIGLFSYYNFDNWAYQPSYVSSNTPWFFNGVRVQIFPTAHLKIEPWFINGWQSYASANHTPGVGGQIKWTPEPWLNIISNNYGVGQDDLFTPGRRRIHTDNSVEVKYFDKPEKTLDKMAFSLTGDLGCEYGAGVSCHGDTKGGPKQSFIGYMFYNRFWFHRDLFGLTVGGGQINNPGRYLVLLPPINGETAITAATNSPYFTENPGNPFKAWDSSVTFDYMPKQYITFRWEYDYRHASVPYWSGAGGITPPGGNNNSPQFYTCSNGSSSGQALLGPAETACGGGISSVWFPDLRKNESFIDLSILVKF